MSRAPEADPQPSLDPYLAKVVACLNEYLDLHPWDSFLFALRNGREIYISFDSNSPPNISLTDYVLRFQKYTRLTPEIMTFAMIYLFRIIKLSIDSHRPLLLLTTLSVHRLLFTSILVASKFHEDKHLSNKFFREVGGIPSIKEVNQLEIEFLYLLGFNLYVSPEEFSTMKAWFHTYVSAEELIRNQPNLNLNNSSIADNPVKQNLAQLSSPVLMFETCFGPLTDWSIGFFSSYLSSLSTEPSSADLLNQGLPGYLSSLNTQVPLNFRLLAVTMFCIKKTLVYSKSISPIYLNEFTVVSLLLAALAIASEQYGPLDMQARLAQATQRTDLDTLKGQMFFLIGDMPIDGRAIEGTMLAYFSTHHNKVVMARARLHAMTTEPREEPHVKRRTSDRRSRLFFELPEEEEEHQSPTSTACCWRRK